MDGEPWRIVPDGVVIRCGLRADLELDRPLLRSLRRELRHAEAVSVAGRTLRRRDISTQKLSERLAKAGVAPSARRSAVDSLRQARVLDDTRLAALRAGALAERGWGDAAIAARLEAEGIGEAEVRRAIDVLPPEPARASEMVAGGADPRKAWALLSRRGFDQATIEEVVGGWTGDLEAG